MFYRELKDFGCQHGLYKEQSLWCASQPGHAERINLDGEVLGFVSVGEGLSAMEMESVCGVSSREKS